MEMSSVWFGCTLKLLANPFVRNDLWEPSSRRILASIPVSFAYTLATAVFNKQTLSPAMWREVVALVAPVVKAAVVGVLLLAPEVVLLVWSVLLLGVLFSLLWVHKLVWCFLLRLWHRCFELHCETLWRARQLKHRFSCRTISNRFNGSVMMSQSRGAWDPLQNVQVLFLITSVVGWVGALLVPV